MDGSERNRSEEKVVEITANSTYALTPRVPRTMVVLLTTIRPTDPDTLLRWYTTRLTSLPRSWNFGDGAEGSSPCKRLSHVSDNGVSRPAPSARTTLVPLPTGTLDLGFEAANMSTLGMIDLI